MGQQANVTVGIVNRERETATYRVEVTGAQSAGIGPLTIENGARVEEPVSFRVDKADEKQQVHQSEQYLELHEGLKQTCHISFCGPARERP